jgi:hypothetical protein
MDNSKDGLGREAMSYLFIILIVITLIGAVIVIKEAKTRASRNNDSFGDMDEDMDINKVKDEKQYLEFKIGEYALSALSIHPAPPVTTFPWEAMPQARPTEATPVITIPPGTL